jgi:hypothetical protein
MATANIDRHEPSKAMLRRNVLVQLVQELCILIFSTTLAYI